MSYIDGFLIAVSTTGKEAYRQHAELAAQVVKEYGALRTVECWGDDVPDGKVTSMPMAVKLQPGETVVFSWIEWPSKAVRDAGMHSFMNDPRLNVESNPMPFDGQRLIFGGFTKLLDVGVTA